MSRPITLILLIVIYFNIEVIAQDVLWSNTYGVGESNSVIETSDGGFVMAGFGGGAKVVKTDNLGNQLWSLTYGGAQSQEIIETSDGGLIFVGRCGTGGESCGTGFGGNDLYLVRTDSDGNAIWAKSYGGASDDFGFSVKETSDNGFIVVGQTNSQGSGGSDIWLIKTDSNGNIVWDVTFGGTQDEWPNFIELTQDEGYIITGYTNSFGNGGNDMWLIKTDASGNEEWNQTYGGILEDQARTVKEFPTGGYIIIGLTMSFGNGNWDYYLVRTDANGNEIWAKTYGETNSDIGRSIKADNDGFILIGQSAGVMRIIKTDFSGDFLWDDTYGGNDGQDIFITSDDNYIATGYQGGSRVFFLTKVNKIITVPPSDLLVSKGDNGIFSVNTSGIGLTYQWQESTDGGSNYSNLSDDTKYSGTTTSSLSISNTTLSDDGNIYRVIVSKAGSSINTSTSALLSVINIETDILTFTIPEETGPAIIDAVNHTVDIEVAFGTDVSSLTPTITLSTGATVSPLSGVAQDFTLPVTYTVTAEDGITIQDWVVTVIQDAPIPVIISINQTSCDPANLNGELFVYNDVNRNLNFDGSNEQFDLAKYNINWFVGTDLTTPFIDGVDGIISLDSKTISGLGSGFYSVSIENIGSGQISQNTIFLDESITKPVFSYTVTDITNCSFNGSIAPDFPEISAGSAPQGYIFEWYEGGTVSGTVFATTYDAIAIGFGFGVGAANGNLETANADVIASTGGKNVFVGDWTVIATDIDANCTTDPVTVTMGENIAPPLQFTIGAEISRVTSSCNVGTGAITAFADMDGNGLLSAGDITDDAQYSFEWYVGAPNNSPPATFLTNPALMFNAAKLDVDPSNTGGTPSSPPSVLTFPGPGANYLTDTYSSSAVGGGTDGPTLWNMQSGTYTVVVTDLVNANGCSQYFTIDLPFQDSSLNNISSIVSDQSCTSDNGSISANILLSSADVAAGRTQGDYSIHLISGSSPVTTFGIPISVSNGVNHLDLVLSPAVFTNLPPGNYSVVSEQRFGDGCFSPITGITIDSAARQPDLTEVLTPNTNCTGGNGIVNVTASPDPLDTAPLSGISYSYVWTSANPIIPGEGTTANLSSILPGDYTVRITDDNTNCTFTKTYTILDQSTLPAIAAISTTDNSGCTVFDGTMTIIDADVTSTDVNDYNFAVFMNGTDSLTDLMAPQPSSTITGVDITFDGLKNGTYFVVMERKIDGSGIGEGCVSAPVQANVFDSSLGCSNTQTDILIFNIPQETGPATINAINHTVDIEVAFGTIVASLTPTVTLSTGATVSPLSGVAQDFSNLVIYTVTAEDGTTIQNWTIIVSLEDNAGFGQDEGWAWVSGSKFVNQPGDYGTQGIGIATNIPSARNLSIGWTDFSGNLWLFGGIRFGGAGILNDLWKYNGIDWIWVSGSNSVNQAGIYGTQGIPATSNEPGARYASTSWTDSDGNLLLLGGDGYDGSGNVGLLNDFWKFDGINWTWISGSNTRTQSGNYGTKGSSSPSNTPGSRYYAISWTDTSGNLWLFGGFGKDGTGSFGELNDLWKYDGTNWIWVSGSDIANQWGSYGTLGVGSTSNVPGARQEATSWIDSSGNLWLFGGQGYDETGSSGWLNDLWRYNINTDEWTWVSGSKIIDQSASYGSKGIASVNNIPGAREKPIGWTSSSGNFWLFGGLGKAEGGSQGWLNDLWKYDGVDWIWMGGSNTTGQSGVYGVKDTASISNFPGARKDAVGWKDIEGHFWIFGGLGIDSQGTNDELNDLWRFGFNNDIKIFLLNSQTEAATVDIINHSVDIEVVMGTDVSSLTPIITLSIGATVSPLSGVAQDFTNSVTYTVTAEDGITTQVWVVAVTILSQPPSPNSNSFVKISMASGGFTGTLTTDDGFANSLDTLGDLNSDGVPDIIIGARLDDDGGPDRGAVWIMFLKNDGSVLSHQKISDTQGGFNGVLIDDGRFGIDVTGIGDLDGDGNPDCAVGEYLSNDGGTWRGAVWILFLNSDGTVKSHQKVSSTQGGFLGIIEDGDYFGRDVKLIGDLDNDGVVDLAVSSVRDDDGGVDRGAVWILFLNNDGTVKNHNKISSTSPIMTGLLVDGVRFGEALSGLGDLDGDGVLDIAVGVGGDGGAVYILFMNTDGSVKSLQKISDSSGNLPPNTFVNGERWGDYISSIGDLDSDGLTEIVVGSVLNGGGGIERGAIEIIFLNGDGTVKNNRRIDGTSAIISGQIDDNDRFGGGIAPLGDFNGDGIMDFMVGADSDDDVVSNSGAMYSIYLDDFPKTDILTFSFPEQTSPATIDTISHTVNIEVALGTDVSMLIPAFTLSPGASATWGSNSLVSGQTVMDFVAPNTAVITIIAEDGVTTQDWAVTVAIAPSNIPTITSFSPISGSVGSLITITGTNFDVTPTNNIVFFGATQATVTAATSTQLTVTVPTGATYQPITVLTNGLVAYSNAPFVVTFPNDGFGIDVNSFEAKVDFPTGSSPYFVSIGDLDGDGKADLAVTNNASHTVSVLRNTSTGVGSVSYSTKVDFSTGTEPRSVSIGDLDGDGKLDMVVVNEISNTVSVLKNTSSGAGSISFAAKVDFPTGSSPYFVSIGDLDGDGKADLAVANNGSNTVSVLRNTGTGAGSISFATKLDFTTGPEPSSVSIGDIDKDGWQDLVVTNNTDQTVSVLRNTSTRAGSISYAAKVDFTTGVRPFSVAIGDLDMDGKLDLAVTNQFSNTVSVFRNTSSGVGTISYDAKVDFTSGTEPISVSIGDLDGDGKADLAVINFTGTNPTVSVFRNTSTGASSISYAAKVDFPIGIWPFSVSIGDLDGDGKADLAATSRNNNTISVFRNAISSANMETDILTFTLSEETGPAIIDAVNHTVDIEVAFGTDVTALISTITISLGATSKVGTTDQVSGITANDFTNPVTYSVTAEDGITSQDWVVTVIVVTDQEVPGITVVSMPAIFPAGSGGEAVTIVATDDIGVTEVTFNSRLANQVDFFSEPISSPTDTIATTIFQEQVTDIGLEYFFLAKDAANNQTSTDTILMVIQYGSDNSPQIPNLGIGGNPTNWRMFSIPFELQDKTVAGIFESQLGTYDNSKWRIVHYKNDTEKFVEFKQGLSIVERSKGYWFNSVEQANIPMGAGKGPTANDKNLSTINLNQGWTQIGNPYSFNVSWPDIITFNGATGVEGLRVFTGGTTLSDATILKAFDGAYVFSDQVITLQVPLVDAGGRTGKSNEENDHEGWKFLINVKAGLFGNTISGLGMHPEASESKDGFDRIRVPRFVQFVDITFPHNEYFAPNFAMDIVPETENYTWEFVIESNVETDFLHLDWDQVSNFNAEMLVLYDPGNEVIIDLRSPNSYSYRMESSKPFKVIYGSRDYLAEQLNEGQVLLGSNYPNPFNQTTVIPFSLFGPDNQYDVELSVYDLRGNLIDILLNKSLTSGIYQVEWEAVSKGLPLSSGLYIYTLRVNSKSLQKVIHKKMLID